MRFALLAPLLLVPMGVPSVLAFHGACVDGEEDDVHPDTEALVPQAKLGAADIQRIRSGVEGGNVVVRVQYRDPPVVDVDHAHRVDGKTTTPDSFTFTVEATGKGEHEALGEMRWPAARVEGRELVYQLTTPEVPSSSLAGTMWQLWVEAAVRDGEATASDRARCDFPPFSIGDELQAHALEARATPFVATLGVLAACTLALALGGRP